MNDSLHSAQSLEFFGRGISEEVVELQRQLNGCEDLRREIVELPLFGSRRAEPAAPAHKPISSLVYAAKDVIPSRFTLAAYAAKFARKVHRPGTDVAKTIRLALERVAGEPTRRDS